MSADLVNGLFELVGAMFLFVNVYYLHRDKKLHGVHWSPTVFFALWSVWSLYFYAGLEQWFSFYAGILLVIADTTWLGQVLYYYYKEEE